MMITVEILGIDVYIGFIAVGIGMLMMTALLIGIHFDNKKEGN